MKFGCKQGHAYDKANTYIYIEKKYDFEGNLLPGEKQRYRCRKCHAIRQHQRDVNKRGYV